MPEFDPTIQAKIATLRAMRAASENTEPYEICKIDWPSPTGPIYYASTQTDEIASAPPTLDGPLQARLLADSLPNSFLPVKIGEEIGDEEVDMKFWDGPIEVWDEDTSQVVSTGDEEFSDLMLEHGEGVRVELFYWFPQVDLLLTVWHGHLRNEADASPNILPVKAVQGFRSSEQLLPSGGHYEHCHARFGGLFDTQEEIDENGCPYNLQIGGPIGTVDPATGLPWTFCNRRDHQSCIDRGVNPLFHLSHRTIQTTVSNGQTKGPTLYSTTFGNQTSLPDPVTVVMGYRKVSTMLIAYRRDLNNNHPEDGWFQTDNEICRGPIQAITNWGVTIGGKRLNNPQHFQYRTGNFGQTALSLSTHGFSNIAHYRYIYGWIDPSTVNPSDVQGDATILGLNDIRVYSDEDTYFVTYTTNPVWQLLRMLCDKIWGYGLDYRRFYIPSWIEAANWCDQYIRFIDPEGDIWDHQRSTGNVELRGKKIQQQIEDFCRSHRLSRPFLFDGKIQIVPLRALTAEELAEVPVFTDAGPDRNICVDGEPGNEVSTLRISRRSADELTNRIEINFDNVADDWLETPIRPIEDVNAQLRAGRVVGDNSIKVNSKKFNVLGVTNEAETVKVSQSLLDLGEFDEGGLMNNCSLKFTIWYLDSLDLHPWKVIRVDSSRLTKYGFQYFRVLPFERKEDLLVDLRLQAYNPEYMATFEILLSDIIDFPDDYPDQPPPDSPTPLPNDPPPQDDPPDRPSGPAIIFDNRQQFLILQ